mgnify:CR=1 FL=1
MKKKLNLLWNLKFNFFSVAERPLTFFAYFLNAKKVGRRRLVIVPATAGGLPLFPHAASVPAPALAPVRSHFACGETARPIIGPAFWVCRAKAGAAFRCAKPPCAVVRFAAGATTGQRGSAAGEMEPNGGKHRFLRSENRDEIEEVKQNAMSLV